MKTYLILVVDKDNKPFGEGSEKANSVKDIFKTLDELPPIMFELIDKGRAKLIIKLVDV